MILSIKTTSYVTDDGEEHKTYSDARRHQLTLDLRAWIEERGICSGGDWSQAMVLQAMLEDADRLYIVFARGETIPIAETVA